MSDRQQKLPRQTLNWDGEAMEMSGEVAHGLEQAGWIKRIEPGGFFNVVDGHYDDMGPLITRTLAKHAKGDGT